MLAQQEQIRGFSLIELMVVVCVLAIGLGLAIPAFSGMVANHRMSGVTNDLVSSLHVARSEALKRQSTVVLCAAGTGETGCEGDLSGGWVVFVDSDEDAVVDPDEAVLQRHGPIPAAIGTRTTHLPAASPPYVAFAGNGFIGTPSLQSSVTVLQLCDGRGDVNTGGDIAAGRVLEIQRTGRPQLHRTRDAVQSSALGGC